MLTLWWRRRKLVPWFLTADFTRQLHSWWPQHTIELRRVKQAWVSWAPGERGEWECELETCSYSQLLSHHVLPYTCWGGHRMGLPKLCAPIQFKETSREWVVCACNLSSQESEAEGFLWVLVKHGLLHWIFLEKKRQRERKKGGRDRETEIRAIKETSKSGERMGKGRGENISKVQCVLWKHHDETQHLHDNLTHQHVNC